MKITYTYTPNGETAAQNIIICPGDAVGGSPIDWRPAGEGVIQTATYPDAEEAEIFGRGNAVVQRPFRVRRFFADRSAALRFSMEQEYLLGTDGTLRIQNEGTSGGVWTARVGCWRALVEDDAGVMLLMNYLFIGPRAVPGSVTQLPGGNNL